MANDSDDVNVEAPGIIVIVSLPALMQSGSAPPGGGYWPIPSSPFSLCSSICTPGGRKFEESVGMPIPRLTYMPSKERKKIVKRNKEKGSDLGEPLNLHAARRTSFSVH